MNSRIEDVIAHVLKRRWSTFFR